MKRLRLIQKEDGIVEKGGLDVYQTIAERDGEREVRNARVTEFEGDRPFEPPPGVDRRTFMTLMGASMALAGAAGCRRPEEKILPYNHRPEDFVDGKSVYYATSIPFYGTGIGLLVESVDGRPIKIEGNPVHPESLGAATALVQATILNLYDPDRSRLPKKAGADVKAEEAWDALGELGKSAKAKAGEGLALLVTDHRSSSVKNGIEGLLRDMPKARVVRWEPNGRHNPRAGAALAFGQRAEVVGLYEQADVIAAFDSDFLESEGSPIKAAKAMARRRRIEELDPRRPELGMNRVYVAEPCPTCTGMMADHRLRVKASAIPGMLRALAAALGIEVGAQPNLDERTKKWITVLAKDLQRAGSKSLVLVGHRQAPAVHALGLAINDKLGAIGSTLVTKTTLDEIPEGPEDLAKLTQEMSAGTIETLIVLGGNPVFTAPADLGFEAALKKVKTSVHVSSHFDETSKAASWHIPRSHELESWGDTRAEDGTASIIQPLIAPMFSSRSDTEIIERLVGGTRSAYDLVREAFGASMGAEGFDKKWRASVHDGIVENSTFEDAKVSVKLDEVLKALSALKTIEGSEIAFRPDSHAWDGSFANNGWMQENPDPIHKLTWTNCVALSDATAKKLGVVDGDVVKVTVGNASVELPAMVTFGHADDSFTVYVGQGRKFEGRVCKGIGTDVGPIRTTAAFEVASGTVAKTGGLVKVATTQGHFMMEGRPLVREQTADEWREDPEWAKHVVHVPHPDDIFPNVWKYDNHKWGMAIDLALCTGCGSCVTACQSENNIPVIGAAGVAHSREMHWIRIDRYFYGRDGKVDQNEDDAESMAMPMLCQHCENAPCEQVCPVAATTHSPEGINEMTYNRCIGTKYCGNNCPFKVRRFNYFNYTADIPDTMKLALNPDVTVRSRGVMEKCTFCVQRVQQAKIAEKKEKDPLKQRAIIRSLESACQQACPSEAITFGDLNDKESKVARLVDGPRSYKVLEELAVRPRVNYLGRVRNPNKELMVPRPPSAPSHAKAHGADHGPQGHGPQGHAPHGADHAKGEEKR